MGIKISAFPNAATNMGSGDLVTGLQGGANVNFSQAQMLSGPDVSGAGGFLLIHASNSSTASAGQRAGSLYLYGGMATVGGNAGTSGIYGGNAYGDGNGGDAACLAGSSLGAGLGGNCLIRSGGSSSGTAGDINMTPGGGMGGSFGHIVMNHLPTSASGLTTGTVWNSSGVLHIV